MALSNLLQSTLQSTMQAVSDVANAIQHSAGPKSQIEEYIFRACDPHRYEPDLALNLEICDIINSKGRTYPREAAMCIVKLVTNRNPAVSALALDLLDVCVKNCGYPFHLQVATKEFLNELVRRFPERPPQLMTPYHMRVLEYIQAWHVTLVQNGKHKEDLRHISDMYRLLSTKGYRFPGVAEASMAVMQQTETLKLADEMEEEDVAVKKAKLQELLRRARPEDLELANQLMKELVGEENRVDYRAKEKEEFDKIEEKAKLLDQMLKNANSSFDLQNETIQELYNHCRSAQAKLQKLLEERDDDLERLLQINEMLNQVVGRYNAIKSGKPSNSVQPAAPQSLISMSPPKQSGAPAPAISLLDDVPPPQQQAPSGPANVMDDLLGLSFTPASAPARASAFGAGPSSSQTSTANLDPSGLGAIFLPVTPPAPASRVPPIQPTMATGSSAGSGTFGGSVAANDLLGLGLATPPTSADSFKTTSPQVVYAQNGLRVTASIQPQTSGAVVVCHFSNLTLTPITALDWQIAVPKTARLTMDPISAQILPPQSTDSAYHRFAVESQVPGELRAKYKLCFMTNGVKLEETGIFRVL